MSTKLVSFCGLVFRSFCMFTMAVCAVTMCLFIVIAKHTGFSHNITVFVSCCLLQQVVMCVSNHVIRVACVIQRERERERKIVFAQTDACAYMIAYAPVMFFVTYVLGVSF